MLSRLVLVDGVLSAGDVLPESLNHLQVCLLCVEAAVGGGCGAGLGRCFIWAGGRAERGVHVAGCSTGSVLLKCDAGVPFLFQPVSTFQTCCHIEYINKHYMLAEDRLKTTCVFVPATGGPLHLPAAPAAPAAAAVSGGHRQEGLGRRLGRSLPGPGATQGADSAKVGGAVAVAWCACGSVA